MLIAVTTHPSCMQADTAAVEDSPLFMYCRSYLKPGSQVPECEALPPIVANSESAPDSPSFMVQRNQTESQLPSTRDCFLLNLPRPCLHARSPPGPIATAPTASPQHLAQPSHPRSAPL